MVEPRDRNGGGTLWFGGLVDSARIPFFFRLLEEFVVTRWILKRGVPQAGGLLIPQGGGQPGSSHFPALDPLQPLQPLQRVFFSSCPKDGWMYRFLLPEFQGGPKMCKNGSKMGWLKVSNRVFFLHNWHFSGSFFRFLSYRLGPVLAGRPLEEWSASSLFRPLGSLSNALSIPFPHLSPFPASFQS